MSRFRHSPKGDVVQLGGVRWTRPEAYGSDRRRSFVRSAAIAFCSALALGVGAGALLSANEAPQPAMAAEAPAVKSTESVAAAPVASPMDREWAARGKESTSALRQSSRRSAEGVRVAFSYCKWGGGTNCVVDGDTFWIGGQKVRIADIDAPETHDYRCRSELELGERAARQLQALLNSGAVTMTSIDRNRDKYGRLLRNVAVNGRDVGQALVDAQVARPWGGHRRPWC